MPYTFLNAEIGTMQSEARSSPLPVFINKVLLHCTHAHTFICCLWLLSTIMAELNRCNINWPAKPKIPSGLLQKMFANP